MPLRLARSLILYYLLKFVPVVHGFTWGFFCAMTISCLAHDKIYFFLFAGRFTALLPGVRAHRNACSPQLAYVQGRVLKSGKPYHQHLAVHVEFLVFLLYSLRAVPNYQLPRLFHALTF